MKPALAVKECCIRLLGKANDPTKTGEAHLIINASASSPARALYVADSGIGTQTGENGVDVHCVILAERYATVAYAKVGECTSDPAALGHAVALANDLLQSVVGRARD
jgi:hypothetical protein